MVLTQGKGRDFLAGDAPEVIESGRESKVAESDVSPEIGVVSDQLPVVMPRLAAVPLAVSVVAQTRPRVGRGPDLPLLLDGGRESFPEESPDVILSGRESTVWMSDVNRDICVEPGLISGYDVHGCRGAAGCTCGRSDEITG